MAHNFFLLFHSAYYSWNDLCSYWVFTCNLKNICFWLVFSNLAVFMNRQLYMNMEKFSFDTRGSLVSVQSSQVWAILTCAVVQAWFCVQWKCTKRHHLCLTKKIGTSLYWINYCKLNDMKHVILQNSQLLKSKLQFNSKGPSFTLI